MLALTLVCLAALCVVPLASGQLTVVNPEKLEVPERTVAVLLRMSCKVAAEQFHVMGEADFPLTLVLGEANEEHFSADDSKQSYIVYLKRWNEARFTSAATLIAVRRLALPVQKKMVTEVLKRSHAIAPVTVQQLSGERPRGGD